MKTKTAYIFTCAVCGELAQVYAEKDGKVTHLCLKHWDIKQVPDKLKIEI